MGWELRRGKRVYYRKEREGRRVRSIYCGSGERGEKAAREDAERRAVILEKTRTVRGESVENPSIATAPVTAGVGVVYLETTAAATLANPSISSIGKKQEKARTVGVESVEELNIDAAAVTAAVPGDYPGFIASKNLTKLNISGVEQLGTPTPRPAALDSWLSKLPLDRRREIEWRMSRYQEQTQTRRAGTVPVPKVRR